MNIDADSKAVLTGPHVTVSFAPHIPTGLRSGRLALAVILVSTMLLARTAQAVVVNFDDIPPAYPRGISGGTYAGLTWEFGNAGYHAQVGYWNVGDTSQTDGGIPSSPPNLITNGWGSTTIGIGFPSPVNVQGAFIAALQGAGGFNATGVTVEGYLDGQFVDTTPLLPKIEPVPTWFEMDLLNVDRIVFNVTPGGWDSGYPCGYYGMDDLTFTYVPEPSALALLALSLPAALRRRRRC